MYYINSRDGHCLQQITMVLHILKLLDTLDRLISRLFT